MVAVSGAPQHADRAFVLYAAGQQDEALKDTGMSKERAAKIANSPRASKPGGEKSHSGSGKKNQGGTTAEHKAADRKGGQAAKKR